MLTYASECNMRFIFESFYFRHDFHECVARVLRTRENNDENKMTRKINLILHSEALIYTYRMIQTNV